MTANINSTLAELHIWLRQLVRFNYFSKMPISWNEIKNRVTTLCKEWQNEVGEDAEAKSFWDDIHNVLGIECWRVATFD